MALSRTLATVSGAAVLVALAGCGPLSFRQLDFTDTEAVRITKVTVLPGAGDVTVRSSSRPDVEIKRVVRYQGDEPQAGYRIEGTELILDTSCDRRCSVSYHVLAPEGVTVSGENGSGNVELSRTGAVELELGSGNVTVVGPTGAVRVTTGSGSIEVSNATAEVTMYAGSGDVTGRALGGTVDAETGSGDVEVELSSPASVRAHAGSGSVRLTVPAGPYRVRSSTDSGEAKLAVVDDPAAKLLLDVHTDSGDVTVGQR